MSAVIGFDLHFWYLFPHVGLMSCTMKWLVSQALLIRSCYPYFGWWFHRCATADWSPVFSHRIFVFQVVAFLKTRDNFIDLLLRHIGVSAIMDLLLRLITCIESTECRNDCITVWKNFSLLIALFVLLPIALTSHLILFCFVLQALSVFKYCEFSVLFTACAPVTMLKLTCIVMKGLTLLTVHHFVLILLHI